MILLVFQCVNQDRIGVGVPSSGSARHMLFSDFSLDLVHFTCVDDTIVKSHTGTDLSPPG